MEYALVAVDTIEELVHLRPVVRVEHVGLDGLADESPSRRVRLQELDALYAWWEKRMPQLRQEYMTDRVKARRRRGTRGAR